MDQNFQMDTYDALVRRVFRIDDVTLGTPQLGFIVRYRGKLTSEDSEAAYDYLFEQFKPKDITP